MSIWQAILCGNAFLDTDLMAWVLWHEQISEDV
jgi:hypothetical protein